MYEPAKGLLGWVAEQQSNGIFKFMSSSHYSNSCAFFALQWSLSRPRIEVEASLQAFQPVGRVIASIYRGYRIVTHLDLDAIATL